MNEITLNYFSILFKDENDILNSTMMILYNLILTNNFVTKADKVKTVHIHFARDKAHPN